MLTLCTGVVAQETVAGRKAELEQLRQKIEVLRNSLDADRDRHSALREQLRQAEREIGTINRALRGTRDEVRAKNRELDQLQANRRQQEAALAAQRELLAAQLRAGHALGQQGYLKLLLSQQDPSAVARTITYYDYLSRARSEHIARVASELVALQATHDAIALGAGQLEALARSQQQQKDQLQRSVTERGNVIARLHAGIQGKERQLQQMTDDEKRLGRLIAALQRTLDELPAAPEHGEALGGLRGKLSWPVDGPIRARFGSARPPGSMRWNGVLIAVPEGTEVRGIAAGQVVFADWLRGFGLLMIIDHGDGYMSLYGHNQSLYKDVGDRVAQDEVIAAVGDSGGREQTALYFEVRHNGVPKNPAIWCGTHRGQRS